MTVIAWDGKSIAADKQATNSGHKYFTTKMRQLENGTLLLWCGHQDKGLILAQWFMDGADPKAWPEFQKGADWTILIVLDDKGVGWYEDQPVMMRLDPLNRFFAWGSGRDFALGAMAMGADARRAVEVASFLSNGCGMGSDAVDWFERDGAAPQ